MHDEIVKLVQRMLDLHKRKQAITRNYITWLESVIGAKVSELSGKDALSAPENLADVGELIKLLNKNRNKLTSFDPKVYRDLEKLTANFEECKKDLDPVVAEIEKTDREIDCLVYKLYDLTPEEIEIVEGRPNPCEG